MQGRQTYPYAIKAIIKQQQNKQLKLHWHLRQLLFDLAMCLYLIVVFIVPNRLNGLALLTKAIIFVSCSTSKKVNVFCFYLVFNCPFCAWRGNYAVWRMRLFLALFLYVLGSYAPPSPPLFGLFFAFPLGHSSFTSSLIGFSPPYFFIIFLRFPIVIALVQFRSIHQQCLLVDLFIVWHFFVGSLSLILEKRVFLIEHTRLLFSKLSRQILLWLKWQYHDSVDIYTARTHEL